MSETVAPSAERSLALLPAANLQSDTGEHSAPVELIAEAMNVSVRQVYKAKAVMRLRPDLLAALASGQISLHSAWQMATGKRKETRFERLAKAWNAAQQEERAMFLLALLERQLPEAVFDDVLDALAEPDERGGSVAGG